MNPRVQIVILSLTWNTLPSSCYRHSIEQTNEATITGVTVACLIISSANIHLGFPKTRLGNEIVINLSPEKVDFVLVNRLQMRPWNLILISARIYYLHIVYIARRWLQVEEFI